MKQTHFLRPNFAKFVIQKLQNGESLNIYGNPGTGKTRLLEDIRNAGIKNAHVCVVSFQGYQHSCHGFCKALSLGIDDTDTASDLDAAIEKMKKIKRHIFLLIDDFKYFPDNSSLDKSYDQRFVDSLNSIKNRPGISLLVVTEKPLNQFTIFIKGKARTSILYFKKHETDALSHEEIENEIKKRFGKNRLSGPHATLLATHLNEKKRNYALLEFYEKKIRENRDSELKFDLRLEKWNKEFKKSICDAPSKKAAKAITRIKGWAMVLNPLNACLNALIKIKKEIILFFN